MELPCFEQLQFLTNTVRVQSRNSHVELLSQLADLLRIRQSCDESKSANQSKDRFSARDCQTGQRKKWHAMFTGFRSDRRRKATLFSEVFRRSDDTEMPLIIQADGLTCCFPL